MVGNKHGIINKIRSNMESLQILAKEVIRTKENCSETDSTKLSDGLKHCLQSLGYGLDILEKADTGFTIKDKKQLLLNGVLIADFDSQEQEFVLYRSISIFNPMVSSKYFSSKLEQELSILNHIDLDVHALANKLKKSEKHSIENLLEEFKNVSKTLQILLDKQQLNHIQLVQDYKEELDRTIDGLVFKQETLTISQHLHSLVKTLYYYNQARLCENSSYRLVETETVILKRQQSPSELTTKDEKMLYFFAQQDERNATLYYIVDFFYYMLNKLNTPSGTVQLIKRTDLSLSPYFFLDGMLFFSFADDSKDTCAIIEGNKTKEVEEYKKRKFDKHKEIILIITQILENRLQNREAMLNLREDKFLEILTNLKKNIIKFKQEYQLEVDSTDLRKSVLLEIKKK
ncbi:hypothetical protein AB837_00595 [bacterium AB1]|nr:hypothetical protein AB837_00595 [bacterium AB1]